MRCFSVTLLLVSFTALRLHVWAAEASVWYFSRAFWRKLQPSIVLGNKLATSLVQVLQALQMLARTSRVTKSSDWIRWRSRWVCRGQGSFYHGTNYQQHIISFGFFLLNVQIVDLFGCFSRQLDRQEAAGPWTVWRNKLFVYYFRRCRTLKKKIICS